MVQREALPPASHGCTNSDTQKQKIVPTCRKPLYQEFITVHVAEMSQSKPKRWLGDKAHTVFQVIAEETRPR